MRVVKGEVATRTSFQRSAKGNVSISECNPEGKFIILENTHRSKVSHVCPYRTRYRMIDGHIFRTGRELGRMEAETQNRWQKGDCFHFAERFHPEAQQNCEGTPLPNCPSSAPSGRPVLFQIWAKNQGGYHHPPDELVFDGEDTWGVGQNVQTILYNKDGEVSGQEYIDSC